MDLAEEKDKLEAVHADVDAVAALLKGNTKLAELLTNPVVGLGQDCPDTCAPVCPVLLQPISALTIHGCNLHSLCMKAAH